jgi:cytochrome P450
VTAATATRPQPLTAAANLLANRPELILAVTRPLRRLGPVISAGRSAIVIGHAAAHEVLARHGDFTVAEVNGPAMARYNGPFVLGMDRSEIHDRERAILQRSVHPDDPERIRSTVRADVEVLLEAARPEGTVDVVGGLARPTATRLVASYMGIAGPDEATTMRWLRAIFYGCFLNVGDDPGVRQAAQDAGDEMHVHMDALVARCVAAVAAGDEVPDTLLSRLVRLRSDPATTLGDEAIRRNLGGVIVGAVDTTSKAVAHIVDQLLRRPDALASARRAALADDTDELARHALEALRFNPINPVLARVAARDTEVANGRSAVRIRGGSRVLVAILPAMFDPAAVEAPMDFRTDRAADTYLHFGAGLHTCFGRYVNLVQIPELLGALLRLDGLRRADGPDGQIAYDGPFPDRLVLEFDR